MSGTRGLRPELGTWPPGPPESRAGGGTGPAGHSPAWTKGHRPRDRLGPTKVWAGAWATNRASVS